MTDPASPAPSAPPATGRTYDFSEVVLTLDGVPLPMCPDPSPLPSIVEWHGPPLPNTRFVACPKCGASDATVPYLWAGVTPPPVTCPRCGPVFFKPQLDTRPWFGYTVTAT